MNETNFLPEIVLGQTPSGRHCTLEDGNGTKIALIHSAAKDFAPEIIRRCNEQWNWSKKHCI
jgi:hypothetical protein